MGWSRAEGEEGGGDVIVVGRLRAGGGCEGCVNSNRRFMILQNWDNVSINRERLTPAMIYPSKRRHRSRRNITLTYQRRTERKIRKVEKSP